MSEWWSGLSLEQQIYYGLALTATVVVALQTLLTLLGGDTELESASDADFGGPEDHPSGISVLSTRTVAAFFVGFGWTGVIASRQGADDPALTAIAASLMGVLFGGVVFFLMRFLYSLRYSGTLDYRNAIGEVGTVYLPIPAAMAGPGRVQVRVQGRLKVIQALTHHVQRLENRARVRVVELLDENTLVVEPLDAAAATGEDS